MNGSEFDLRFEQIQRRWIKEDQILSRSEQDRNHIYDKIKPPFSKY